MRFEFATASRIIFGEHTLVEIGSIAARFGKRALVVSGLSTDLNQPLIGYLAGEHITFEIIPALGEPTVSAILQGLEFAWAFQPDLVIGIGGGSAIDTAKALAILFYNPGEPYDYLEVIGRGQPLTEAPLPCVAIPTTAGTGAEVTRNAVIGSPQHAMKVSLRSPLMLPKIALVDPVLTHSLPAPVTASTGMDALTQLIEPYVSLRSNPLTDAFCRDGIPRAARSLLDAFHQGENAQARIDMSLASLFGGLALANAGLGAVHGFASPLGGMYPAPHGAVCARLLPPVMASNVRALQERDEDNPVLLRYTEIACWLTGNEKATAGDGVTWIEQLGDALAIPRLGTYGIKTTDIPSIVSKARSASSMKANPLALSTEELEQILAEAI